MITAPSARNADLTELVGMLRQSYDLRHDLVVPAEKLESVGGEIVVVGADAIDPDAAQTFRPTEVFDGHLAEKLGVPTAYLRRLREQRADLFDANVNGWLRGWRGGHELAGNAVAADSRSFMFRSFYDVGDDDPGIARALLSQGYMTIDHLDVLLSVLEGIKEGGINVAVVGCDLTETRMWVRIAAPEIRILAPEYLGDYRSPFTDADDSRWTRFRDRYGLSDADLTQPIVAAGLDVTNSETGSGAASITPRFVVPWCANGQVQTKDAVRQVHLGKRLDEGVVRYSDETHRRNLELVKSMAKDAVRSFLDVDYVRAKIDEQTRLAGKPVENAQRVVEHVSKQLSFSETERDGILDHFIRGGALTAGGVMQAVTSYAQIVESADRSYELERSGLRAMELAAA